MISRAYATNINLSLGQSIEAVHQPLNHFGLWLAILITQVYIIEAIGDGLFNPMIQRLGYTKVLSHAISLQAGVAVTHILEQDGVARVGTRRVIDNEDSAYLMFQGGQQSCKPLTHGVVCNNYGGYALSRVTHFFARPDRSNKRCPTN